MAERFDEELFLGYLEGDLSPEQIARFEKQLQEDAKLRNLVAQLVLDRHRLRNMPQQAAPPEVMERVNQRLERSMLLDAPAKGENADPTPIQRFRLRQWLTYGAVAALVVVVGAFILHWLPGTGTTTAPELASNQPAPPAVAGRMIPNDANETPAPGPPGSPRSRERAAAARDSGLPTLAGTSEDGKQLQSPPVAPPPPNAGPPAPHRPAIDKRPPRPGKAGGPGGAGPPGMPPMPYEDPIDRALAAALGPVHVSSKPAVTLPSPSSSPMADATVPGFEGLADDLGMTPSKAASAPPSAGVGVVVHAANAQQITKTLQAWADEHDVRVMDARAAAAAVIAGGSPALDKESPDAGAVNSASQPMVLVMEQHQLDELISYLNLESGQSASMVMLSGAPAAKDMVTGGAMAKAAAAPTTAPTPAPQATFGVVAAPAARAPAAESAAATQPPSENEGLRRALGTAEPATASSDGAAGGGRPMLSPYARVAIPIYILLQQAEGAAKAPK